MLAEDSVSCIFNSAQNPFSARLGSSLLLFRLRWNFLWSLGVFHARIWHGLPGRLLTRHSAANNDSIITSSSQFAELYGLVPAVPSPYAILRSAKYRFKASCQVGIVTPKRCRLAFDSTE